MSLSRAPHRFIPYCSSDVWSGATPKTDQSKTQCVIAQCVSLWLWLREGFIKKDLSVESKGFVCGASFSSQIYKSFSFLFWFIENLIIFLLDAFQALGKASLIYSGTNQPTFTHPLKLQKSIKGGEKQHLEKYSPLLQLFPLFCVSSHVYELHTHE